jgi:hypothetical protein
MHGVGVPASNSQSHLHSSHSLDGVAKVVVMAASATVSNIVGMIGSETGPSMQTATMKVQWCVSFLNRSSVEKLLIFSPSLSSFC